MINGTFLCFPAEKDPARRVGHEPAVNHRLNLELAGQYLSIRQLEQLGGRLPAKHCGGAAIAVAP